MNEWMWEKDTHAHKHTTFTIRIVRIQDKKKSRKTKLPTVSKTGNEIKLDTTKIATIVVFNK